MAQMNRFASLETWLRGLVGGVIGGASSSICMTVVDPSTFNFQDGWPKLWHLIIVTSLVSAAMYLKQSPLPAISTTTETTVATTTTVQQATVKSDTPTNP